MSQSHAIRVTQILNVLADSIFPSQYNSDFAVQVTPSVSDPGNDKEISKQQS